MSQNRSTAVMQRRVEPHDSLDFFPTPPWATRALCEHVLGGRQMLSRLSVWEPACGEGHMARPLAEYFDQVHASDVHAYGYGEVDDFLFPGSGRSADFIITNPPFRLAREFVLTGLERARVGVCMLVRLAFLESIDRHDSLFRPYPPTTVAQFVERVAMVKGCVDPEAASATAYCWIVWTKLPVAFTRLEWIPPCRSQLERPDDYASRVAA